ncbi:hypothetical protein [Vibrio phage VP4B]|uniref:Uncharacterized protein n=1 Tax=Vibrio phage VP4B TaxID=1262540 RepID=V9M0P6_9CAUD|nr:hypothetical protein FDJ61_gp124 [Vibrio phage VP4B]AGB07238.1 hypothetical protein [Vibrio phage VP4B]
MFEEQKGAPAQISTVKKKYEASKSGTDAALRDAKEPLDPKDQGDVKSELPNDGQDFKEQVGNSDALYSLGGLSSLPVDGQESFMDTVKDTAEWLWKRAVDIFNMIVDYVYNRVATVRRRITRLKYLFNDHGVSLKECTYPGTITRLTSEINVPRTPDFALKTLEHAQKVYNTTMSQQNQITKVTRPFPPETTREQLLNFAESVSYSYTTALGGKKVKDNIYEIELPSGFQVMKSVINRKRGFNGFTLTEFFRPKIKIKVPENFIASAEIVQRLLLKADVLLMDVEKTHKSQRSFSNAFQRSVDPLKKSVRDYPPATKEELLKYYRWLVNYQHRTVTIPLNYYLSVISASVDLAKAQIHKTK